MENYSTPKPMKQISDLFSKYRNHFKAPQATVEKEAVLVIKELTNFDLTTNQVIYTPNTKTLYLKIPSVLKSELKLHYPNIINRLKISLGSKTAPEIII